MLHVINDSSDVAHLNEAVEQFNRQLSPVLKAKQQAVSTDDIKALAKDHGSTITALLKSLSARLVPGLQAELGDVLARLTRVALLGLDQLRPVLKAKSHDLEVQKYNFVRKLITIGQHGVAREIGMEVYASLLASLEHGGGGKETWDLLTAAILNVTICTSEMVMQHMDQFYDLLESALGPMELLLKRLTCVSLSLLHPCTRVPGY